MAIISRLPQGSGGGNITKMITINGGVGETISILGEDLEDSVLLDSTGTSQYILIAKKDTLVTFTGGLSGYIKRIAMVDAEDAVVKVMPEGALYWYGNLCEWNSGGYSVNGWTLDKGKMGTFQANQMYAHCTSSGYKDMFTPQKPINATNYTKLCYSSKSENGQSVDLNWYSSKNTSTNLGGLGNSTTGSFRTITQNITSLTGDIYVAFNGFYNRFGWCNAIWLE